MNYRVLVIIGALLLLVACGDEASDSRVKEYPDAKASETFGSSTEVQAAPRANGWVDAARLASPDAGAAMWMTTGGDAGETHYSRLDKVNRETVHRLGVAWDYQTGTTRGLEGTPTVIDGVMYASGVAGAVYALEAQTGKELWTFEPRVDMQANRGACCDMVNRGVAVWKGKVYVAAFDGVLYALDAADGDVIWKVDTIYDHSRGYSSTGAPQIAGDVVVIGNGGAEFDARGYVTAYDLESGDEAWRFFTVPGDPSEPQANPELEAAVKTWSPESRWDLGLGGTVWDSMAYDSELGLVYIGVGNGGPYPRSLRSPGDGDNLYLSSIVALDAKTGRVAWHYQTTPGDSWDYTATQPFILTDIEFDGEVRKVLMQAPKNGFFYILDRQSGELLSAKPYVHLNWAKEVDLETGRPVFLEENADYSQGPKIVFPATPGGHNWHPMAWDPERRLAFFSVQKMGNLIFPSDQYGAPRRAKRLNMGAGVIFTDQLEAILPGLPEPLRQAVEALPEYQNKGALKGRAALQAFDPVTGDVKWSVEKSGWWDQGGVLATAGDLVFSGSDTGVFSVYDADTGELLKSIDIGTSIIAAPMSYEIDGVQYVAVMAAWGGGGWSYPHKTSAQYKYGNAGRILSFKLDGDEAQKPAPRPDPGPLPEPPTQFGDADMIAEGRDLFMGNCAICHSNVKGSNVANLNYMSEATHEAFDQILLEGMYLPLGMPRWDDAFTPEQVRSIHAYLIDMQSKNYERQENGEDMDDEGVLVMSK